MDNKLNDSFLKLMQKKKEKVEKQKETTIRDIGGAKHVFICDNFIYHQQSNSPEKYFIFERFVRKNIIGTASSKDLKSGDIEYRISYYIVSRKPDTKTPDRWIFGQFAPMIPAEDFENLIKKAREAKLIID